MIATSPNQQVIQTITNLLKLSESEIFDNFRPCGYVFFSNKITNKETMQLFDLDSFLKIILEHWELDLTSEDSTKQWNNRFQLIVGADIRQLKMKTNFPYQQIIKSIEHIDFHSLTLLSLYRCRINNVEALSFINAPNLETINLIFNYAFTYKSLAKANFKLKQLMIYSQTLSNSELDNCSRWSNRMNCLRLEKSASHAIIMNDLSFLAKVKTSNHGWFGVGISKERRILQNKLGAKFINNGCSFFGNFMTSFRYDFVNNRNIIEEEPNDNQMVLDF